MSVSQHRQVTDCLSRRRTRFNTRSVHVRFCGGQFPLRALRPFRPISFYRRSSRIRPTTRSAVRPSVNDSSIQQHNSALHFISTIYSHVSYGCHNQQSCNITMFCPSLTFGTGVLHLIQINHQPDAKIFQFIILTFVYSSTCFGRFPAHHQELNDCSGTLWFYLRIVVIVVLRS